MTLRPTSLRSLLLTLGLVGALAAPAAAADLTVAPADTGFGAGRPGYGYTLNPGGQVQDGVVVANTGTAPLQVTLRADGLDWVSLDRAAVSVPAGGSVEVPFAVALPQDAAPGDHVGAIVASGGGSEAQVPIRLRVGGPLKPGLSVEDVRLDGETVTYTVRNTGNAILRAHPSVSVTGPFGRFAATAGKLADTPALAPGKTWTGSARVSDVTPAFRLTATVTLLPLLTDAAGSTTALPAVEAGGHAVAIPWALVLAVLVLVAGVGALARRRVRVSSIQHLG